MNELTPEVVKKEVLQPQVLALAMVGKTPTQIAKELKASPTVIKRMMATYEFREALRAGVGNELEAITLKTRERINRLLDKAVDVIEANLDEGSLQAAVVVLKVGGFLSETQNKTQDTSIQIVLPSRGDSANS